MDYPKKLFEKMLDLMKVDFRVCVCVCVCVCAGADLVNWAPGSRLPLPNG